MTVTENGCASLTWSVLVSTSGAANLGVSGFAPFSFEFEGASSWAAAASHDSIGASAGADTGTATGTSVKSRIWGTGPPSISGSSWGFSGVGFGLKKVVRLMDLLADCFWTSLVLCLAPYAENTSILPPKFCKMSVDAPEACSALPMALLPRALPGLPVAPVLFLVSGGAAPVGCCAWSALGGCSGACG